MSEKIENKTETNKKTTITIDYEKFYELYQAFAKAKFNVTTGLNQYYLFSNAYIYTRELIEKMEKEEYVDFEALKAAVSGLKAIVLLMFDFLTKAERELEVNVDKMLEILITSKRNN